LVPLEASIQVANGPLKTGCIGIFFHTTLCNSSGRFHSPVLLYVAIGLDLKELLVVAVDSVPLAASIQQPGSLIRIAGNRRIGIFPYISVEIPLDSTASIGPTGPIGPPRLPSKVC